MTRRTPGWMPAVTLVFAATAWVGALVTVRAVAAAPRSIPAATAKNSAVPQAKPATKTTAPKTPASSRPGTYVSEDTCTTCHGAQAEGYEKTPHHEAADPRTPAAAKGCQTCHGPGSEHVQDPVNNKMFDFKKAKSDDINATCTTCHNKGEHALWSGSKHESRGLACTTCHSVHDAKSPKMQLKAATESQLCATCHRDKVTKLDRVSHMPVSEGGMSCSTCHNPHGSTNVKLLRKGDSVNDLCTSCHADKRGPFLWEHAPVRQNCTTCHDSHGSQNDSMLVAKLPLLCQRCHISTRHPSTLYDATQLAKPQLENRGCVNCHIQVHGSNHPVGQFFLR